MKNCKWRADKTHVFFSHELKMMPVWFPWIFVGGVLFIVLSFVGAKYKDKEYKNIQFLQDFISGSILIAFTGVLVPDLFPVMDLPTSLPNFSGMMVDEMELQVGPPRLMGR
jgi:hypothetical protein